MAEGQKNEKKLIDSIQLMRIICAFSVILLHSGIIKSSVPFYVDMFFIISAFFMMMSTEKSTGFSLFRRIMRIGPLYWIITVFTFFILLWKPSLSVMSVADSESLLKSICFLPIEHNGTVRFPVVCVGWTVNYEIFFSLIFSVAFLCSGRYRGIIAAFACIAGFIMARTILKGNFYAGYWFDSVILDFVLGIAAYCLLRPYESRPAVVSERVFCSISSLVLFAVLYSEILLSVTTERALAVCIPSFVLFLCFYKALEGIRLPKLLAVMGSISYSVYLAEYFSTAVFKLFKFSNPVLFWMAFVVMAAGTYAVSYLLWLYIEKRLFDKIMSIARIKKA